MYITDPERSCDFFIGLAEHREGPAAWWAEDPSSSWRRIASLPFVDASLSPLLPRALYIPYLSRLRNRWMQYVLLQRTDPPATRGHKAS